MTRTSPLSTEEAHGASLFRFARERSGGDLVKARKLLRADLRVIHGAYARALDLALEEFARERAATRDADSVSTKTGAKMC